MFPEGTRNKSGTFMGAEPGLSMVLQRQGPCNTGGDTFNIQAVQPIRIIIGQPIYLEEYYDRKINMDSTRK